MTWKDEFLAIVSTPVLPPEETGRAWRLKHENMPSSLFRYRSLSRYTPGEIENDTVRIMAPHRYNDPFDSLFSISNKFADDVLQRMIPKIQTQLGSLLSQEDIESVVQATNPMQVLSSKLAARSPFKSEEEQEKLAGVIKQFFLGQLESMTLDLSRSLREKYAICCFSERNDSILMWSHYANQHQGICIEYPINQMAEDDVRRRMLLPVFYKETIFDGANVIGQQGNPFVQLLACMHKAPEWSYEQEWRLTMPMPVEPAGQDYPMIKPRAIYLGAKHESATQEAAMIGGKIRDIAKTRNIALYQMSMARNAFRLEATLVP